MKPSIIVINRKHFTANQNILRKLLAQILSDFEGSDASIYPNELIKDFICIAQLPNMKIGLYESNSKQSSFAHELDFFAYKACDLIFCHSPILGNLSKKLIQLRDNGHVNLIIFDKIWLDTIPIPSLENYEVEKLLDLIYLRADVDSTIELNQSSNKQSKIS